MSNPFAPAANPFAPAGGSAPTANPFAPAGGSAPAANPFAPAGGSAPAANPFAPAGGGAPAANPFAVTSNPFGATNTFGSALTVGTAVAVPQAPSIAAAGAVGQTIDSFQRAYAPIKARDGRWVSEGDGVPNEDCEFKTIVYKQRMGLNHHDALLSGPLLEQAEHHNPDPEHLVPARELGVTALKARFDTQQKEAQNCKSHIKNLTEVIEAIEVSNAQTLTRFEVLKAKQISIYQGILAVMRKIEVLRAHDSPVQAAEVRYRERLSRILAALRPPFLELQELASSLAQQEHKRDAIGDGDSEQDIEFLSQSLRRQQEGIEYISEVLAKDTRDIGIMKSRLMESRSMR